MAVRWSSPHLKPAVRGLAACAALLLVAGPALPQQEVTQEEQARIVAEQIAASQGTEVERFCSNIADAARDRRYAMQTAELLKLQEDVDKRIALLEEKRAEYEGWLKRRNDFLAEAETGVVKIYAGMKPDSAAERLAEMEHGLAAAILMKIEPRKASVILNEMEPKTAAALTGIMASAARKVDPT